MSSDIPYAREILEQGLDNGRYRRAIERALPYMVRSSAVRRAPVDGRTVTKALAKRIRHFSYTHPTWSEQRIAVHFHVNAGRVSEAINGKR